MRANGFWNKTVRHQILCRCMQWSKIFTFPVLSNAIALRNIIARWCHQYSNFVCGIVSHQHCSVEDALSGWTPRKTINFCFCFVLLCDFVRSYCHYTVWNDRWTITNRFFLNMFSIYNLRYNCIGTISVTNLFTFYIYLNFNSYFYFDKVILLFWITH